MIATLRHSRFVLSAAAAGLGLLAALGAYRWFWASGASADRLEWAFQHDETGRLLRVRDPGGKTSTYDYLSFPGEPRQLKTVTRRFSGGQEIVEFDHYGRRSSMQDQAGTVRYTWNNLGQLAQVERTGGATISYAYDALGRLREYSLGAGNTISYSHDLLDRVAAITTPAGVITYTYLPGQGKTVRTLPNGVRTVWDVSPYGQVAAITHVDRSNDVIARFAYEYRPDGLVASVVEWAPQRGDRRLLLEYDQVQRLVGVQGSDGRTWSAAYDAFGNQLKAGVGGTPQEDRHFDWAGRLLAVGATPATHDASANLTSVSLDGRQSVFDYDVDNRLRRVNNGEVSYDYDGDGNLVARTVRGERTTFVPDPLADGWHPLIAKASNGAQRLYLWAGEQPLGVIENGQATFFLTDHLDSVRGRVDGSGAASDRLDYSPFGVFDAPVSGADLAPGFAGLFWDPVAGIYLTKARAYSPQLGRFLQPEPEHRIPVGSQKDMSIYAYCGGDPVNFADRVGAQAVAQSGAKPFDIGDLSRQQVPVRGPVEFKLWEKAFQDRSFDPIIPDDLNLDWSNESTMAWYRMYLLRYQLEKGKPWAVDKIKEWFPDEATRPNMFEVRDAENSLLMQMYRETGKLPDAFGVFNVPSGEFAEMFAPVMMRAWQANHFVLDPLAKFDIPIIRDLAPLPQDFLTIPSQKLGLLRGRLHLRPDSLGPSREGAGRPFPPAAPTEVTVKRPDPPYVNRLKRPDDRYPGLFPPDRRQGGPMGRDEFPPPGGGGSGLRSPLRPSPVGGVYLGGAGTSLAGLGPLRGISVDPATGRLVLVAEHVRDLKLPPLRLDDVVTVFRSVYLHGVGPSVTIDPRPEDPEGPLMNIVHGAATGGTYVGWVLFEADRIMKAYSLGQDSVTSKPVTSTVPGYSEVRDSIFFGGNHEVGKTSVGDWERFWIVPAEVNRFDSGTRGLTLVDVPLKVRTQKMVMKNGKLEDDMRGSSSAGALTFSDWFTRNYEAIGRERYLQPPAETGITAPVPVFAELRRIAMITAIAEQLRDQGVPMPSWVSDYELKAIPLATTTPAITVRMSRTAGRAEHRASIYGGVNLSVPTGAVRQFRSAGDMRALSPERGKDYARLLSLSASVVPELERAVSGAPLLTPVAVRSGEVQLRAVALPGAGTQALLPGRVREVDLEVSIEGGESIALARLFNSFFQPTDAWGKSWSMDLPRLEEMRVPQQRTDRVTTFKIVFELTSPLGSYHERFSESAHVPAVGGKLLVPDKAGEILGLAGTTDSLVPGGKTSLIFRDSRCWIFDAQGNFVADKRIPYTTVYLRDSSGRVRQIAGYVGDKLRSTITLNYGRDGRLESAQTEGERSKRTVAYSYGRDGSLESVTTPSGRTGYLYERGLVTTVLTSDPQAGGQFGTPRKTRQFTYDLNGQVLTETAADGTKVSYSVAARPGGWRATSSNGGNGPTSEVVAYDTQLRPLEHVATDKVRTRWTYASDGSIAVESGVDGGDTTRTIYSADRRRVVTETPERAILQEDYDEQGRLTGLTVNQQPVYRQSWRQDGLLKGIDFGTHEEQARYDQDGRLVGVVRMQTASDNKVWQEIQVNQLGNITGVRDSSGVDVQAAYDTDGAPLSLIAKRDGKNYGVQLQKDAKGRIEQVQSSWGRAAYRYDAGDRLKQVEVTKGPAVATADYQDGRIRRLVHFDQGLWQFDYYRGGALQGLCKSLATPVVSLSYRYSADGMLSQADVGGVARWDYTYDSRGRLETRTLARAER